MSDDLYIGLMSGTSLDAIDVALVSIDEQGIELIDCCQYPYPPVLREQVLSICGGECTTLPQIGSIDHKLGKLFSNAVNNLLERACLSSEQIRAVGSHGQTVYHRPSGDAPFSLQLGDANLIAALTGIDTVADFRRIDMALGGQGAPLVPAFHKQLFAARDSATVVLNIGGISNISVIPARDQTDQLVTGYDTGPGNILMDAWCLEHTGKFYDKDAVWGRLGSINKKLLDQLMGDPYLVASAPKSTGREHYSLEWLDSELTKQSNAIAAEDVQRTLCEFTALSIASQVQAFQYGSNSELLVCGGGAGNPLLMERLNCHLQDWLILPTSDRGIPEDYMEAMAFAWFARQRIHNLVSSLPSVTGARCGASLGVIYPTVKLSHSSEL